MVKRDNGVTSFVLCSISKLLSTQETIQRYQRHTKAVQTDNSSVEENMQHLKHEAADMAKQIELLEVAKRKLLGEDLGSCTMEELQQIEQQLERSVSRVRAKKMEAFMEQIDQLKEKEKVLTAENAKLCEKKFLHVLLFPEGTTANGIPLMSFQLGAFIPGYPVQPVIVRYPHVYFDQSWGNVTLAMLMFRMFMQFHNFMEVEYIPVVSPLENQKENAIHFAKRDHTGHAIATALNVVQTGHVYGDFMLFAKAAESKQDIVESTFHLSSLEAMDFLDTFLSMNPDSRVLRLKACGLSEKIFGILDVEKRGKITFKQFVYGSAHVLKQPLFRQACELAFTECYVDGNHYISEQE
ncbi:unnamed protein product [Camellia sinensis]